MAHHKKHPSPKTKSPPYLGTFKARQMRPAQIPKNLLVLYQVVKKLKGDLLGQEMEWIIDADEIMQFATMQEISANCIAVYMK